MSTAVKVVDVIIRKTAAKTASAGEGHLSISLSAPSVIQVQGSAQDVARYVRQGQDLLIYMKDGSLIRCKNYFMVDAEGENYAELVFNDQQELTHVTFPDSGDLADTAMVDLTDAAQTTTISSIDPFLTSDSILSELPWGWMGAATLGGGAVGALLSRGGDTHTEVIDNTRPVETVSVTPTFFVTDQKGDQQGVLSNQSITDDNTPTFSGTGQPGATIQIKDSEGNTVASAMVDSQGLWSVKLPEQSDGSHTWSVVQIDGSKITDAGDISLTVNTAASDLTMTVTADDNVINASEQASGFALSGTSNGLPSVTVLTVTLNGKVYSTTVAADGLWHVSVPAADAAMLGDGTWTVVVSGKDSAGNIVTAEQRVSVDTQAPAITVDVIAQDNVLNAAEHQQALTLSGRRDCAG